ncbi:hypothetical protein pneo_cds_1030 [Pandoravirus neocaledonia]|uniref:Uncharacterized protein n=1 Tax=Pandoravirus neocaledonia TaxID=2107708 RepID=A0A2U7UDW6_9VIRU|nr:hypothetical protein pneo_cds_1030 [Pandoravirus neocaledonia]AVK76637.1 hypothetical protein pneo_cds_1030 [Pandoravirus neocaledonia]
MTPPHTDDMLALKLRHLRVRVADLDASRDREREYVAVIAALRRRESQLQHEIANLSTILNLCEAAEEQKADEGIQGPSDDAVTASSIKPAVEESGQIVGGSDRADGPTHALARYDPLLCGLIAGDDNTSCAPCDAPPLIPSDTKHGRSDRFRSAATGDRCSFVDGDHGGDDDIYTVYKLTTSTGCRCAMRAPTCACCDTEERRPLPKPTIAQRRGGRTSRNLSCDDRRRLAVVVLALAVAAMMAVILVDVCWPDNPTSTAPVPAVTDGGRPDTAAHAALSPRGPSDVGGDAQLLLPLPAIAWCRLLSGLFHGDHGHC